MLASGGMCADLRLAVYGIHPIFAADDQALRIWDIREKRRLQTLQDKSERWGQVTCLKRLSINSSEGNILCFGTGRGLILVYQGGRDLVSGQLHLSSVLQR